MILYDYCRSSAAYRVRIALNLKGMDYEQIPVNLLKGEQGGDENRARNAQGFVPSMEDNGEMFNQSLSICEYLDDAYPETVALLPVDAAEKARVRSLAQLIACDIHPVNNLRILKYLVGEFGVSEEQKIQWYQHWVMEGFAALEKRLAESDQTGKFCHGDTPSLADVCLVPQVFNANRFKVDMSVYPTISRIADACNEMKAFADAHPDLQPGA